MREKLQLKNISDIRKLDSTKIIDTRFETGLSATRHCLKSIPVQEFITRLRTEKENSAYDVMLVGDYYQEALLYLAELIGCPVVALSPLSTPQLSSHYFLGLGELNVYAFHDLQDDTADNSLAVYSNKKYKEYLKEQEALIKESFELPEETTINFTNLYQRVVYILSNTYNYFNPPSPIVSGKEIKVGGYYIRAPKELSRDIKDFLHEANYGAIFVTLPSQVYGVQLDMDVVSKLMTAFSGMKQKILFEWDGPKVPDQPKNVFIRRWIPISDILAHPYVQLMIATGDIIHIQNSIQRSVPLIGIPITKEQEILLKTVEDANIGKKLLLADVTVERVMNMTKEMFGNQMMIQQLHYVSSFYRNRPLGAIEEAVFWVEFAGKNKLESRIYRHQGLGASVIPPYYTKLITVVGGLSVLAVLVLIAGGAFVYKVYFKNGRKGDKKAV